VAVRIAQGLGVFGGGLSACALPYIYAQPECVCRRLLEFCWTFCYSKIEALARHFATAKQFSRREPDQIDRPKWQKST